MTDLITLEDFQSIKGVGKTGSDQRISALIPQVSALVRKYCNRTFTLCECEQEIYLVWDEPFLLLQEIPVKNITSIRQGPAPLDPAEDEEIDESKYFFTKHTGQIRHSDGCWSGPETYRINYFGGFPPIGNRSDYTEDGLTDEQEEDNYLRSGVPEEVKLATIDLVNYYFREEYKENKVAQAYVLETPGTSSVRSDPSFPDHIKRVLDMYKLDNIDG